MAICGRLHQLHIGSRESDLPWRLSPIPNPKPCASPNALQRPRRTPARRGPHQSPPAKLSVRGERGFACPARLPGCALSQILPRPSGLQPEKQQQSSLGVGQVTVPAKQFVDALARESEDATQVDPITPPAELCVHGSSQFVPERRIPTGTERGAAADPPREGAFLCGLPTRLDGGDGKLRSEFRQKIQLSEASRDGQCVAHARSPDRLPDRGDRRNTHV
jgi:hypothetical protein